MFINLKFGKSTVAYYDSHWRKEYVSVTHVCYNKSAPYPKVAKKKRREG